MSIRLLLVGGSDIMRAAIRQLLTKELGIEVIGTAKNFTEALALTEALKPDVLLMDLHMSDESICPPTLVKSQALLHTKCIVAMSLWNDDEAMTLAEGFGADVLLDKMKLYSELIPAIKMFCPRVDAPEITIPHANRISQSSIPSIAAE